METFAFLAFQAVLIAIAFLVGLATLGITPVATRKARMGRRQLLWTAFLLPFACLFFYEAALVVDISLITRLDSIT